MHWRKHKAIKASDAIDTSDATSASVAIEARKKSDAFEASVRRYSKSIGSPEAIEASNDRNDRHIKAIEKIGASCAFVAVEACSAVMRTGLQTLG